MHCYYLNSSVYVGFANITVTKIQVAVPKIWYVPRALIIHEERKPHFVLAE